MKYDIPSVAVGIARWQAGVMSRQQLLAAGLTAQMITTRLERGRWQMLYRGVYAVFNGPPPRAAWLWAAVLRAGPGALLSHLTAAELHGLIDTPAEAIFVTVPSTRRIRTPGIIVRMSGRVGEARQPGREPPRTSVEETVFDLIELALTFDDACGWITRAVGRRLSTEKKLRAAMSARKKMRWRAELGDVLAAAGDGIHSVLEYRYLRDVERAHGLPRSRHQVRVVIDGKAAYRDATTTNTSSPSSWMVGWRTRTTNAGAITTGTTRQAPGASRRPAMAGAMSTATAARRPCCRRRSCDSAAGREPRGRAPGAARWGASGPGPERHDDDSRKDVMTTAAGKGA